MIEPVMAVRATRMALTYYTSQLVKFWLQHSYEPLSILCLVCAGAQLYGLLIQASNSLPQ